MVTEIKACPQIRQPDNEVEAYRNEVPLEYIYVDLAPAMPNEILLGSLRDGRLRVASPLQVRLTYEGKHTIAEAIELDEFGFGNNWSEALIDLQRAIVELYFTLEKGQKRLGTDLQRIWNVLQEKILKR
jgi:hypothetical protein